MTLARQGREPEAIAALREDLAKRPGDVGARRLLVRLLADTGDMNGAKTEVAVLEAQLGEHDPVPYIELGHAYELQHRFEDALAAYDQAASVAPASPAGPREGGMRCARWGEVEEARPRLEEAVRRGARDAATWHALGLVRVQLHDLDGAEQAYRAGVAADPDAAENWLGVATVGMLQGDAAKALQAYDAILARRPRAASAELGRAWALMKLGRKEEARRALDRAEELGAPPANVAKQRAALAQ
jgi:tetratricopeptide (TPR) repeat protein